MPRPNLNSQCDRVWRPGQIAEVWRPIPFAPNYLVSSWGNVMGQRYRLTPTETVYGYLVVSISIRGSVKSYRVNRLVAICFHGEPPFEGAVAAHNDGIRKNNHADNIRWATPAENTADRIVHGTHLCGSAIYGAKLDEDKIPKIRERLRNGERQVDIAKDFGVSPQAIAQIGKRQTWQSV